MHLASASAAVPHLRAPNPLTLLAAPLPPGQPLAVRAGSAELCVGANATWWSTATLRCGDAGCACGHDVHGERRAAHTDAASLGPTAGAAAARTRLPKGVKPASQDRPADVPWHAGRPFKRYKAAASVQRKRGVPAGEARRPRRAKRAGGDRVRARAACRGDGAPSRSLCGGDDRLRPQPEPRLSFNVYDGAAIAGSSCNAATGRASRCPVRHLARILRRRDEGGLLEADDRARGGAPL